MFGNVVKVPYICIISNALNNNKTLSIMTTLKMTTKEFNKSNFFLESIYKSMEWFGNECYVKYYYKSSSFEYTILVY